MKTFKNTSANKRAIIYARVSTEKQKDNGYSLQEQMERLRKFCEREGYTIVYETEESHSAKHFDNRPEFQKILKMLQSKMLRADILIVTNLDRFSRHSYETYYTIEQLKNLKLKVYSLAEGELSYESPEDFMRVYMQAGFAHFDNLLRGDKTQKNMRQAMREGRFVGTAPVGYKSNTLTKEIEINPNKAPYIIKCFEEAATGVYSAEEIRRRRKSEGIAITKQTMLNILRNPTYYGKILMKAYKDEPKTIVNGIHEPIISEELFYKVQDVLNGKRKKMPTTNIPNENLPLRGHLECPKCGGKLTGSGSVGRNKNKKHYYYHCQHGCKERFKANEANEEFEGFLGTFEISKDVLKLYDAILEDEFSKGDVERKQATTELDKKIEVVRNRKASLDDRYLDAEITGADYNRMKQRIDEEERELERKRTELGMEKTSLKAYFDYSLPLLHNLRKYYSNANLDVKQKIIGSIFPEKLIFSQKKYRTAKTNEFISLIMSNSKGLKEIKKPTSLSASRVSHLSSPSWA